MLDSVPVPVQAILWPLLGAAVVLAANRFLPQWLGRLLASATALASLAALWSMRNTDLAGIPFSWTPLGVFRTSPVLEPSSLALFGGLILASITATSTLGIRGMAPRRATWHGLLLIVLAGSLIAMMGGNLSTMAIGSAVIDLALIAMAVLVPAATDHPRRLPYSMIVAGIASTFLITFGALQMSTRLGTTSLLAADIPVEVPISLGLAGLLRLMVYPLHPRKLGAPQDAVTMLLVAGTGLYFISRMQTIAPVLEPQQWPLILGVVALAAGGFLVWAYAQRPAKVTRPASQTNASTREQEGSVDDVPSESGSPTIARLDAGTWLGLHIHQIGLGILFLMSTSTPWPLLSFAAGLGLLAIWWDAGLEHKPGPRFRWVDWIAQQAQSGWTRGKDLLTQRFPAVGRWRASRIYLGLSALLPAVAITSLAGIPLTAGAVARWSVYGAVLDGGQPWVLLALLAADTFLMAGLWQTLPLTWKQARRQKPGLPALVAMAALAVLVLAAGIAPDGVMDSLGLTTLPTPLASKWGLGLLYILPWLMGAWLARVGGRIVEYLRSLRSIVNLDWLYRGIGWLGQRLLEVLKWLGRIGEGDGWWGWALIILALGTVLLASR